MKKTVMLSFLLVLIIGSVPLYAETEPLMPPEAALKNMARASDLLGKAVSNTKGDDLGRIQDLIVDQTGTIAFVIIGSGGVMGVGDRLSPVPWATLQAGLKPSKDRIIANLDKETLANAPMFEAKKWPNFSDSQWMKKVSDYFHSLEKPGISPNPNAR